MQTAEAGSYVMLPRAVLEGLMKAVVSPNVEMAALDVEQLREDFLMCCRVDLRLSERTIVEHRRHLERFIEFIRDRHPLELTARDLREFLIKNPARNAIKFLRVFYGKFLKSDIASSFRIPQSPPRILILPDRRHLDLTFYNLKSTEMKAAFLMLASSGLRLGELCALTLKDINFQDRMILPTKRFYSTKNSWVTFFNSEAEIWLRRLIAEKKPSPDECLFTSHPITYLKKFKRASQPVGSIITPKTLRAWFADQMAKLGVQDRYIDAFCGRVPKSVLARHYTDLSAHNLHQIYVKAGLKVNKMVGFRCCSCDFICSIDVDHRANIYISCGFRNWRDLLLLHNRRCTLVGFEKSFICSGNRLWSNERNCRFKKRKKIEE